MNSESRLQCEVAKEAVWLIFLNSGGAQHDKLICLTITAALCLDPGTTIIQDKCTEPSKQYTSNS